jgi:Disaggregatase related repeat
MAFRRARLTTRLGVAILFSASVLSLPNTVFATEASGSAGASGSMLSDEPATGRVPALSSEKTNVYAKADGTYRLEAFGTPVNFLEDGHWQPIHNDLVDASGAAYAVQNAANDYTVQLPQDAGTTPVKLADDAGWVSFAMDGLDGAPTVDGSEATYESAGAASEVAYEARTNGVKESVVLDHAPEQATEFTFSLRLSNGLYPDPQPSGEIVVRDGFGASVYTIAAPFMVDSKSPAPAVSTNVDFDIEQTPSGWQLTLTPDLAWLRDAARTYPVTIDPTITQSPSSADGWINEDSPTTANPGTDYLRVGGATGVRKRSLVKFSLGQVTEGATVTAATLKLYLDSNQTTGTGTSDYVARRVTEAWTASDATWNRRVAGTNGLWSTAGGVWAGSSVAGTTIAGTADGYKSFEVTPMVQSWINNGLDNNGFIVKKDDDTTNRVLRFFSNASGDPNKMPRLEVTFTDPAPTPAVALASASCIAPCDADWSATATLTPTLTATIPYAGTQAVSTSFEVRNADTAAVVAQSASLSGQRGLATTWAVPSGALSDLTVYEYRASGTSGTQTSWSAWQPFGVDVDVAPTTPSDLALSPCDTGCATLVSTSLQPTFVASHDDEDTEILIGSFDLRVAGSSTVLATSGPLPAGAGGQAAWTVPSGTLTDNTQYEVRGTSSDQTTTTVGSWTAFSTALPASGPAEPANLTISGCAAPCADLVASSTSPTFSAKRVDSGAATDFTFEVRANADTVSGVVSGVASQATATWTVPSGELGGGDSYEARVGATAAGVTTWTGWRPFVVDTLATVGADQPSLGAAVEDPDSPVDPNEVQSTDPNEDEGVASGSYDDSDLVALDAAADAEYQEALGRGETDPDGTNQLAKQHPVWVKYAPKLYLYPGEDYMPLYPTTSLIFSDLNWSHAGACGDHRLSDNIDATRLGNGYYHHQSYGGICFNHSGTDWHSNDFVGPKKEGGPDGNDGMYIDVDNNERDGGGFQGTEPVFYDYHYGWFITYWFHYGYSAPDSSAAHLLHINHEEDWESITIELSGDSNNPNRPVAVRYSYHHSGCQLKWSDVPKINDRHPKVAVAKNTHASYPVNEVTPDVGYGYHDKISTDGSKWYANRNLLNAENQVWWDYGGIWGENGNYEDTSGPLGPGPARRYDGGWPTFTSPTCTVS